MARSGSRESQLRSDTEQNAKAAAATRADAAFEVEGRRSCAGSAAAAGAGASERVATYAVA